MTQRRKRLTLAAGLLALLGLSFFAVRAARTDSQLAKVQQLQQRLTASARNDLTPEQRAATRAVRPPWWALPTKNTHDLATVSYLCSRAYVLYQGSVMERLSVFSVFRRAIGGWSPSIVAIIVEIILRNSAGL